MSKKSSIHTRQRIERLDIILLIILSIWVLLILFPFYEALMSSLVNSIEFTKHPIIIWPQHFVLDNYRKAIKGARFFRKNVFKGHRNFHLTSLVTVLSNQCYGREMRQKRFWCQVGRQTH